MPARRSSRRWRPRLRRPRQPTARRRERFRRRAPRRPPRSTRRSMASSSRSSWSGRNSPLKSTATQPPAGPNGIDRVEFWVQTNPGTRPGPLMKVASGGELARFLLALKVVLADRGSAPTLVFDEIDTGVGGAVADAIGMRLAKLGARRAGPCRDACAAGGGACRSPLSHQQGCAGEGKTGGHPRHRTGIRSAAARRSPACLPAPKLPAKPAPRPSG